MQGGLRCESLSLKNVPPLSCLVVMTTLQFTHTFVLMCNMFGWAHNLLTCTYLPTPHHHHTSHLHHHYTISPPYPQLITTIIIPTSTCLHRFNTQPNSQQSVSHLIGCGGLLGEVWVDVCEWRCVTCIPDSTIQTLFSMSRLSYVRPSVFLICVL